MEIIARKEGEPGNEATEEVRQAPAHAPCGPSFNCMFDIPWLLYVSRDTLCICKLAILVHTPLRKLQLSYGGTAT